MSLERKKLERKKNLEGREMQRKKVIRCGRKRKIEREIESESQIKKTSKRRKVK